MNCGHCVGFLKKVFSGGKTSTRDKVGRLVPSGDLFFGYTVGV